MCVRNILGSVKINTIMLINSVCGMIISLPKNFKPMQKALVCHTGKCGNA